MEKEKITDSTLGFGKILLSASNNIFIPTVVTSMYNPCAPVVAAVEHTEVGSCVKNGTHEVKEDAKKKEEQLYTAMSTVALQLLPVQHSFYHVFGFLVFKFSTNGE